MPMLKLTYKITRLFIHVFYWEGEGWPPYTSVDKFYVSILNYLGTDYILTSSKLPSIVLYWRSVIERMRSPTRIKSPFVFR